MDQSITTFSSDLLENRIRQRRADAARDREQTTRLAPTVPARLVIPGRDDAIFEDDEDQPRRRVASSRFYPPSPAGSSSRRTSLQMHRTTGGGDASQTPPARISGNREMEEQLDKLSKQNFDLKLEVYHRREKNEELEQKLVEMAGIKEDNSELLAVNEDLLRELEKRDVGIDEAMEMICNLEDTVERLRRELSEARTAATQRMGFEGLGKSGSCAEDLRLPLDQPKTATVTCDTPARSGANDEERQSLADATHQQTDGLGPASSQLRRLPSFLRTKSSNHPTLREMFPTTNNLVRHTPSIASFASENASYAHANAEEMTRSPALSVLSESEFRSVYGDLRRKDENGSPTASLTSGTHVRPQSPTGAPSTASEETRMARINKWVTERSASPPTIEQPQPRQRSPYGAIANTDRFQSLSNVLWQDSHLSATHGEHELDFQKTIKGKTRMGAPGEQSFGRDLLPPTPDTMLTRPSNQSSLSVVQELHRQPGPRDDKDYNRSITQRKPLSEFSRAFPFAQDHPELLSTGGLLPKDMDTYGRNGNETEQDSASLSGHLSLEAIGRSGLSRLDAAAYGYDEDAAKRELQTTNLPRRDHFDAVPPTPEQFSRPSPTRRVSVDLSTIDGTMSVPLLPYHNTVGARVYENGHRRQVSQLVSRPSFTPSESTKSDRDGTSAPSLSYFSLSKPQHSVYYPTEDLTIGRRGRAVSRPQTSQLDSSSPIATTSAQYQDAAETVFQPTPPLTDHDQLQPRRRRSSSIRQRIARLARRNSASTQLSNGSTASFHTPGKPTESASAIDAPHTPTHAAQIIEPGSGRSRSSHNARPPPAYLNRTQIIGQRTKKLFQRRASSRESRESRATASTGTVAAACRGDEMEDAIMPSGPNSRRPRLGTRSISAGGVETWTVHEAKDDADKSTTAQTNKQRSFAYSDVDRGDVGDEVGIASGIPTAAHMSGP